MSTNSQPAPLSVMILGVGSFAHSMAQILKDSGATVSTYLTRDYAHYGAASVGPTYNRNQFPSPCALLADHQVDLLLPMSIDWAQAPWWEELLSLNIPIFSPTGEG